MTLSSRVLIPASVGGIAEAGELAREHLLEGRGWRTSGSPSSPSVQVRDRGKPNARMTGPLLL